MKTIEKVKDFFAMIIAPVIVFFIWILILIIPFYVLSISLLLMIIVAVLFTFATVNVLWGPR